MATFIATTYVNSGTHPITLTVKKNKKGQIRSVELTNGNLNNFRVWQYMDLLSVIMPKYLYFSNFKVELGGVRGNHFCLVLKQEDTEVKYYQLDKIVDENWPVLMPVSQLRALVFWWRCNRSQFEFPVCKWKILRDADT